MIQKSLRIAVAAIGFVLLFSMPGCSTIKVTTDGTVRVYQASGAPDGLIRPLRDHGLLEPGKAMNFAHWRGDVTRIFVVSQDGKYTWTTRYGPDYNPMHVTTAYLKEMPQSVQDILDARIVTGMLLNDLVLGWGPPNQYGSESFTIGSTRSQTDEWTPNGGKDYLVTSVNGRVQSWYRYEKYHVYPLVY